MEQSMRAGLSHRDYETRKKTALALEPVLRELVHAGTVESEQKLRLVIAQLCELAGTRNQSNARSGGAMGLASLAIALGPRLADYLGAIILPVLACFEDHDSKLRYFACESMYNIAKVAQGELLVYFNELFDTLSKLHADTDQSVKNGAELLDRLLKDIVTEQASTYVSVANYGPSASPSRSPALFHDQRHAPPRADSPASSHDGEGETHPSPAQPQRAFSLPRFIPLLGERMTVLNPFTRSFLISWLDVLDSVPELELISYLPDFLEGLLRYLGDPTGDVSVATDGLLERFLREIKEVRDIELGRLTGRREQWEREAERRSKRRPSEAKTVTETAVSGGSEEGGEGTPIASRRGEEDDEDSPNGEDASEEALATSDEEEYEDYEDGGEWTPGQGVHVDYPAIAEILVRHLSFPDEEIQSTCLHWIAEFLQVVPGVLVSFSPRLIPVILSALAHHVPSIQQAAVDTNDILFSVIQALPVDSPASALSPTSVADFSPPQTSTAAFPHHDRSTAASPPPSSIPFPSSSSTATPRPGHDRYKPGSDASSLLHHQASLSTLPSIASATSTSTTFVVPPSHKHNNDARGGGELAYPPDLRDPYEPDGVRFQYGATVNELTLQFLSENEETRVAALEWLLMLHQKAPRKIIAGDDPSLPTSTRTAPPSSLVADSTSTPTRNATSFSRQRNPSASSATSSGLSVALLLKMLSDPSERVLRYDLQLLAQISSTPAGGAADEEYFPGLMSSLLELFSTDRKLLETRGSLIIRQLCVSLNAERIYRTCAEILEKDEDLEFASIMVQNLNLIMITSPEFAEFRKRLRTLDTKDGQSLFVALYRSWSHNAVATFTLCLLAQAYEQACALLQIFADLEITVSLLVQIDKLVQLIESPVFTSLRLQLLEPDRYPHLLKAMYGLLMLLPQSSAFATLRNRLSAVSTLGFLGTVPRTSFASPTALRPGSTLISPSSSSNPTSTLASRRNLDGAASGVGTPDPPSIRWNELLTHFRVVQKRRANATSGSSGGGPAAGGGGGTSIVSPRASGAFSNGGGRGGESESLDGISPPAGTSSTFGTRFGGGATKRKTGPVSQQSSWLGGGMGGATASGASSTIVRGSAFAVGAPGRPVGSGFVSTSSTAAAAARATSPTLLQAKRRIGSAPLAGGAAGASGSGPRRT
ncbi:hypothetical protein JCM11251_007801 [Rhodosporidiobolus azoricus]